MAGHPLAWRDWQRREDYYSEGVLLWLDADARPRELSGGNQSLDDFAHRFLATHGAMNTTIIYTLRDVCSALNAVAKDDWPRMLRRHLESHSDDDAMARMAHAGWRLYYDEQPTETFRQDEAESDVSNLDYSIGLQLHSDGAVRSVSGMDLHSLPASLLGAPIRAVNGQSFALTKLEQAVKTANSSALSLTFEVNGPGQTAVVDYFALFRANTITFRPNVCCSIYIPHMGTAHQAGRP